MSEMIADFINWDEVRRRLREEPDEEYDEESLETGGLSFDMLLETDVKREYTEPFMPSHKIESVLIERARALATAVEEESDGIQIIVFSLAGETYGISTDHVKEVQPLPQVSLVPCAPDFVVGVINIRGSIYSVIDIHAFFGAPRRATRESDKVILIGVQDMEVGILAEEVSRAITIPPDDIKPPLAIQSEIEEEYIRGVTDDMLIVLDLAAMLRDERLIVCEEVA